MTHTPDRQRSWDYQRRSWHSPSLGSTSHTGVLRPTTSTHIRGSLYFLHGGNGNDEQWVQSNLSECLSETVDQALRDRDIQLVLPSVGVSFLRDPHDAQAPSYWKYFIDEVMPSVEADTETSSDSRWISGISMGGYAALSAMLRRPDGFAGCGVHFPGLIDFDPFDDAALAEYQSRTGIAAPMADILASCFRGAFRDREELARHDPIRLIDRIDPQRFANKSLYVDVGGADDFGLRVGCDLLASRLAARDIPLNYTVVAEGRHDMPFVQSRISQLCSALLGVARNH